MERHRLTRPETIGKLWKVFIAVLASVLFAELLVEHEARFDVERLFGFYALFGFAACAALIIVAKAVGVLLKRPDAYYDDDSRDP